MNKIVVSDKFEHSDKGFRYFTGYTVDDIIRPLCILLPQMNRYIGKNMTFKIEDCNVLVKYNEILNIIKKMLNIKLRNKLLTEQLIHYSDMMKFQKEVCITPYQH